VVQRLMHTHIFGASGFPALRFTTSGEDDSLEGLAMQGMMDLGRFGDERLQKGGRFSGRSYG